MSTYPDPCVCGGSREKPNDDCERCCLIAQLAAATNRADEAEKSRDLSTRHVGRIIRDARIMAGFGMRQFAQLIGFLPSRQSDIEQGQPATAIELNAIADKIHAHRQQDIQWREDVVAKLAAAESARDDAVRWVERLKVALEWIVQPDILIGSNAEFQHRAIEVAKAALLQPQEADDGK